MNRDLLQMINKEVYRRFPEVKDKPPRIQKQEVVNNRAISKPPTYLLIYRGQVSTADQKMMPRLVRVVVNEQGKILKISTSR
jgi:hypothetical protein